MKKRKIQESKAKREEYAMWLSRVSNQSTSFGRGPRPASAKRSLSYDIGNDGPRGQRLTIQSKVTPGASTAPLPDKVYTGTSMLGVGTMHKSNAIPVFTEEVQKDLSKMRR